MRCPYCASEVPQAAIVCPHCAHDFYLFKPLLERIEQLEARLLEQAQAGRVTHEERIAALESELAALKAGQPAAQGVAVPLATGGQGLAFRSGAATPLSAVAGSKRYWVSLALALSPTLALLVVAHIVLLFVYDVKPLYLRFASILIPIPFGFALLVWHPHRFRISAIGGFAIAAVAVWLMLVTTAYVDNVPVMPQRARDMREVLEYMASIGLAFLTGLLLGKLRYRRLYMMTPEPNRLTLFLAELFTTNKEGELGVVRLANRIQKTVSAFTPIGAGAASIYAGIKALIGDGG
jgi:hypothetical protein